MPIRLKCSCGKVLSVRDELAGKAVKCPGCQAPLRVPAGSAPPTPIGTTPTKPAGPARPAQAVTPAKSATPTKRPAAPRAAAPAAPADGGSLDDLFNEAGFQLRTGKTCPACFAPLAADAVLCTQCGLHLGTGDKLRGHVTELEDEQSGEAYLRRAAADMARSKQMQDKMVKGAGMPWWMLGLVLFLLISTAGVAAVAVNISTQKEATTTFDAVTTMLMLAGGALWAVGMGAQLTVIYRAFVESLNQGLLVLFVPGYILFYGITRFRSVGMALILAIIAGGSGVALCIAAAINGGYINT